MTKRHNCYFYFMEMMDVLENGGDYFLPNLSIDLIIIGYQDDELKCLLLKIGDKWALPGGYVGIEESVEQSVSRVLMERTGLENAHMKFLAVFGDKNRQFGQEFKTYFDRYNLPWRDDYWINKRFITLSYYALVDIENTHPSPGNFDEAAEWFNPDELPNMWLDHEAIVLTARDRLKSDIKQELVTHNLLPDTFTMPQLHQLHQTILDEKLDRSRFQKKMLASGRFERLPQVVKDSPGRNPYQYRHKD